MFIIGDHHVKETCGVTEFIAAQMKLCRKQVNQVLTTWSSSVRRSVSHCEDC